MSLLKYVNRQNTDCEKWDGLNAKYGRDDLLPMWVADMDFQSPDCVIEAVKEYAEKGVFGYYSIPDAYYDAFISWEREHFNFDLEQEWIRHSPGVVAGINWILQIVTEPGDAVIILSPVYYPFKNAIVNNNRKPIECDLINENGKYSINFIEFEEAIVRENVKCFILCSPHNPVSRVWTESELKSLLDICRRHGVFVISDEIHQDFVFGPNKQIPSFTVVDTGCYDDMMIALTAPSKTFNLAGMMHSIVIIPDEKLRTEWDRYTEQIRVMWGNNLGYIATRAAYEGGALWLEELKEQIYGNYLYLKNALKSEFEDVVISELEGTYLMWIDIGAYVSAENMRSFAEDKCRLAVDYGEWFGGTGNDTHIRLNLATSAEIVEEAADRLLKGLREVITRRKSRES